MSGGPCTRGYQEWIADACAEHDSVVCRYHADTVRQRGGMVCPDTVGQGTSEVVDGTSNDIEEAAATFKLDQQCSTTVLNRVEK